jgi:CBS domain-containing protein
MSYFLTLSTKIFQYDCKSNIKRKGNVVHSIVSSITVYEALKLMGEKNVGAVLVRIMYLKVLSERDYARKIVLKNKASKILLYMKSWREMLLQLSQQIILLYGIDEYKKNQTLTGS